jgi:molybdopterin synthase catalytic subunit
MYSDHLRAELARQRIAELVAEADRQRLIRQARRHHTASSARPGRPTVLVALTRRVRRARRPADVTA